MKLFINELETNCVPSSLLIWRAGAVSDGEGGKKKNVSFILFGNAYVFKYDTIPFQLFKCIANLIAISSVVFYFKIVC